MNNTVNPEAQIWRYMSIHEFLALIGRQTLIFRQFKSMWASDKQEGMVPEGFWKSWEAVQNTGPVETTDKGRLRRENTLKIHHHCQYVSCWHMPQVGDSENALMWMAYAPKGLAVKTTVARLCGAKMKNDGDFGRITPELVTYSDDWSDLESLGFKHGGVMQNRLFLNRKRSFFKSEQELRLHIQPRPTCTTDKAYRPPQNPEAWPGWFEVEFESLDWIEEVVAEGGIASWSISTLTALIEHHDLRFRQSGSGTSIPS